MTVCYFFYRPYFKVRAGEKNLCPVSSFSVLYDTNLRIFCSIDDSYRRIVNCEKPTENDIPNQPQARFTNSMFLQSCRKEKNWDSEMYLISVFIKYLFCSGGSSFFCNKARDYRLNFNQWNQTALLTLIIYVDRCRMNGPNNSLKYYVHVCHNISYIEAVSIP